MRLGSLINNILKHYHLRIIREERNKKETSNELNGPRSELFNLSGYEKIQPFCTYAPWLLDEEFLHFFDLIKDNTLVDKYRCYELWQLIDQLKFLDGALLEVGVWRGGTAALIAKKASLVGIQESIFLADTFKGVVKASDHDTHYTGGEHHETSVSLVHNLLNEKLGLRNYKLLKGIFPDESGHLIAEKKFRFCHIDVDVYLSAKDIIYWIWDKLEIGGIVVFDDYGFNTCTGITKLVNEIRLVGDRITIYNLNGHALMIKIK